MGFVQRMPRLIIDFVFVLIPCMCNKLVHEDIRYQNTAPFKRVKKNEILFRLSDINVFQCVKIQSYALKRKSCPYTNNLSQLLKFG